MRKEPILIGPMGVGKSYISDRLSERLGLPHLSADWNRFHYYEQIGYDHQLAEQIKAEKGLLHGLYQYWKPFEIYALEKMLAEYQDCIFDLGAGHSVYDGELFTRAQALLADFCNIFFLLPSPDEEESLAFLMERKGVSADDEDGRERLRYFISPPSNYALGRHIVYVKGKSEAEICDEIIGLMRA